GTSGRAARWCSARGDVLLAADMGYRQASLLQGGKSLVDHLGVAAQVGNVMLGMRLQLGQHLLHVAAAIPRARLGTGFAAQATVEGEAGMRLGKRLELLAVQQLALVARPVDQDHLTLAGGK